MAEEVKEYLDLEGLTEYDKKAKELFQDLTIQDVEEAFNELDESDPSYSAFYDVIAKAKEATQNADSKAQAAVTATNNANTATTKADEATARANKAAEKLETVNDMTTGVNLVRGSMDWKTGTEETVKDNFTSDGWYIPASTAQHVTYYKDDEGFTVLNIKRTGLASDTWSSCNQAIPIKKLSKGDVLTVSLEFMVEDVSVLEQEPNGWKAFFFSFIKSANNVNDTYQSSTVSVNVYANPPVESGKWTKAVFYIVSNVDAENLFFRYCVQVVRNGSIHFRKPVLLLGRIHNPVYSVAPADISLEPVNDITTGTNLIRGSRDFVAGIDPYKKNTYFKMDGFVINNTILPYLQIKTDDQGYGVLRFSRSGLSQASVISVDSSVITDLIVGEYYTISFEYMVEDVSKFDQSTIMVVNTIDSTMLTYGDRFWCNASSDIASGKWYQVVNVVKLTNIKPDDVMFISLRLGQNGTVNFRKLKVERGNINNPVWSASPFDYASSHGAVTRLSGITKLENNTDLDTITTYGMYCTPLDADAQTMTNVPDGMRTGFVLEVSDPQGCGNVRVRQKLTTWTEGAVEYTRLMNTDKSWTNWRQTYGNTTIRPIAGGGTGKNTARGASNAILGDMRDLDNAASEGSYFVFFDTGHSDLQGAVAKRSASLVWEWIAYKIEQTYNVTKK